MLIESCFTALSAGTHPQLGNQGSDESETDSDKSKGHESDEGTRSREQDEEENPRLAVDFDAGFRKTREGRGDFFVLIVRLAGSKGSRIPHAAYIAGSRQPAEQGVEADGDRKQ